MKAQRLAKLEEKLTQLRGQALSAVQRPPVGHRA
jgi:hypothetical protein